MSVRRLSIQCDRDGGPVTVDLALPAGTPVGALLPAIVELTGQASGDTPRGWRLDRISGATIDESITLSDNGVQDGDLLVLTGYDAPPLGLLQWDPCRTVADTGPPEAAGSLRAELICVWAAVVGSLALCSGVAGQRGVHLLIAAVGACCAAGLSVTGRSAATGLASVPLAAATGFLAVPSGPAAANVFLAAVAATATSLLMLRWLPHPPPTLVATACVSTLVAVAVVAPVLGVVPVGTVGATMTVAALGLLALSGRISILWSGLAPDRADDVEARAVRGHVALTGLVQGCSGGVAVGVVLVALGCQRHGLPAVAGGGFGGVAALVLFLRVRTHVGGSRRWALTVGGMVSASAVFAILGATMANHAGWASALLVAIGLVAVRPPRFAGAIRTLETLEYAALFAIVPLACWVGGVYAMVRAVTAS